MKIFLSALEASGEFEEIDKRIPEYFFNLMSYYYIQKNEKVFNRILDKSKEVMIDSGAHTFQKGKKLNWEQYTKNYAEWIQKNDTEKILGYFEMDIDPAGYSYDFVKELRAILLEKSDKIIPVWHKNRGIEDFKDMCKNPIHRERIVAITGFKNEDIKDEDYIKFLTYAKKHNCKVHCLGMTREKILEKVPFDFVDSSAWKQSAIFGRYKGHKISRKFSSHSRAFVMYKSYIEGMKMQLDYLYKGEVKVKVNE